MKQKSDGRGVVAVSLVLALTLGSVVVAQSFTAQSGATERRTIDPDKEIQSYLKSLISTNKQVMFEGTEESLSARLKQLRKIAGQDTNLVIQLMYFSAHANGMEEAMLPAVIVEQLAIPHSIFAEVCIPLLESKDEATRELAAKFLPAADGKPGGGVDFSRYEAILRENKQNPPQGLIRYMYDNDPRVAVLAMARIYGQNAPEPEIAAKADGGVKESLNYFAGRSEWWAHLYVAAMMEKAPHLQTSELLKKMEQDADPLVREKVSKITKQL